jgi:hypothetical protein
VRISCVFYRLFSRFFGKNLTHIFAEVADLCVK